MNRSLVFQSALLGATLIPFCLAPSYAKSDRGVNCACTSGTVTHVGSDGSECTAFCDGKHAGTATARATGDGSGASASVQFGGRAKSTASDGGAASSEAQPGNATSIASGSGSQSQVVISGGRGKATATSGGNATANSAAKCEVIAMASNNGTTGDDCLSRGSKAVGTADDSGNAHAETLGNCKATANATGDGSDAEAYCDNNGTTVTAIATGGGVAIGYDYRAPQCTPNGGTAMVTSPAGNCP